MARWKMQQIILMLDHSRIETCGLGDHFRKTSIFDCKRLKIAQTCFHPAAVFDKVGGMLGCAGCGSTPCGAGCGCAGCDSMMNPMMMQQMQMMQMQQMQQMQQKLGKIAAFSALISRPSFAAIVRGDEFEQGYWML